ncbi:MAG TPA: L-threonylcarbamoyladenylate synthase [Candidatus Dojkabacteria bacterium]|nr:L-threonylcarbamoyladenylate synthase [Candidatus Dojkabacteria bacterium]
MEIIKLTEQNLEESIAKAVEVLKAGGTVIYPTETCYGIGVDATNQVAVDKVYDYKGFRGQKPFSMAVTSKEMAAKYVEINDIADNLYKNYLPGPVTVVSNAKPNSGIATGVVSQWGSIGIRIPDHKIPVMLVEKLGKPMTSTSANVSYKPVPYSIESFLKNTPKKSQKYLDLILDYGELPKNVPSTVLDTTMNSLQVLREGKIEFENAIKKSKLYKQVETKDPEETISFAKEIADHFITNHDNGALVFALSGELGAGKTQFSKGVGEYLKVEDIVNSPTYTIINEYKYNDNGIDRVLVHMDTWRISDVKEFNRSGLQEYLEKSDIILIEWADKYFNDLEQMVKSIGGKIVKINFEYLSQTERKISVYESN